MGNDTDSVKQVRTEVFILSYASKELLKIVHCEYSEKFINDIIEDLKKKKNVGVTFEREEVLVIK